MASLLSIEIKRPEVSTKSSGSIDVGIKEIISFGNEDMPVYYIINYENDNGFLLISADIRTPVVLAFSPKGNFEESDNMPLGLIEWMNDTKEMVDAVRSGEIEPFASPTRPLLCEAIMSVQIPDKETNEISNYTSTSKYDPCDDDDIIPPVDCITQTIVGPLLTTNWGWGGSNDGWFTLETWNPKGGKGYYKDRDIIYNISK